MSNASLDYYPNGAEAARDLWYMHGVWLDDRYAGYIATNKYIDEFVERINNPNTDPNKLNALDRALFNNMLGTLNA